MNRNQKIALGIGLLLITLNGLFPPFEAEEKGIEKDWPTRMTYLGYHFIFSPPSHADVVGKATIKVMSDVVANGASEEIKNVALTQLSKGLDSVSIRVVMSVFIIQFITIVSLTIGACILFWPNNVLGEEKMIPNVS